MRSCRRRFLVSKMRCFIRKMQDKIEQIRYDIDEPNRSTFEALSKVLRGGVDTLLKWFPDLRSELRSATYTPKTCSRTKRGMGCRLRRSASDVPCASRNASGHLTCVLTRLRRGFRIAGRELADDEIDDSIVRLMRMLVGEQTESERIRDHIESSSDEEMSSDSGKETRDSPSPQRSPSLTPPTPPVVVLEPLAPPASSATPSVLFRVLSMNVSAYKHTRRTQTKQIKRLNNFINESGADVVALQEDTPERPLLLSQYKDVKKCAAGDLYNSFFVRIRRDRSIQIKSDFTSGPEMSIKDKCSTPRCAAFLRLNIGKDTVTICNVQLCGSFQDEGYLIKAIERGHDTLDEIVRTKENQIEKIIKRHKPDIILGDFHGDVDTLADRGIDRHTPKPPAKTIDLLEKYRHGVHAYIRKQGYLPTMSVDQVKATSRDGGVVDWIYITASISKKLKSMHVIETLDVSDHNALIVDFQF